MRYLTQEQSSGKRLPHVRGVQGGGLVAVPWSRGPENGETPGKRPGVWEPVRCSASKTPLFSADGSYAAEEGTPVDAGSGAFLSQAPRAGLCV